MTSNQLTKKDMKDIYEQIDLLLTEEAKSTKVGMEFKQATVKKVASMLGLPKPYPKTLMEELKCDMLDQYAAKGHIKSKIAYYRHYNQNKPCAKRQKYSTLTTKA